MISLRFFLFPITVLFGGFLLAGFACNLKAQTNLTGITADPLDHINPALRPLVQSAATNSWKMDLQDILVKRAEALSLRYDSIHAFKLSGSAIFGYQIQETRTGSSDGWNSRFNVTAKKPLYTWGAAAADHQFGLLEIEKVKQGRQLAFLAIYRDVVYRFIDYTILRQRVFHSRLSNEIFKSDVDLKREQVDRGEFPATQFATMELNLRQEELRFNVLANSLEKAGKDLLELIGQEDQTAIDTAKGIPAVADDLTVLEGRIENFLNSLDENSLRIGEKQARLGQELERLKKLDVNQRPKLSAFARYRQDSENVITGDRRNLEYNESFAGIEVSWNVYDGKNTAAYVKESLESRRQLERELADLKRDIQQDIGYFFEDLKIQREQSLLGDTKFYWEQGRFNQMEEDVKAGRSPENELKAAKRDLERERVNQWDMRGRYYKALTNLYVMLEYPSILAYLEE